MASVKSGLEVFLEERLDLIKGKRVGIIVNPSSVSSQLEHTLDLLFNHPEIELTTILGPQHGVRGETQDNMIEWEDYRDLMTQLPVYSLYGNRRSPAERMLANVDTVIFDLQDVGARYYTFIYTMALAMKSCRERGKSFIVLDRPNPINGIDVEGTVLDPNFSSFVGLYPLAVRHGMTVGELALYFNQEFHINCELQVVKMREWKREMFFEDTALPWVLPSPNIPTVDTSIVYPGMCLLEGTNISEGRGTSRPFEFSGAPWVEPHEMVRRLSQMDLPGTVFRPLYFVPTFHKWSKQMVGGVQIHVLNRKIFRPFRTGLALLKVYREMGEDHFQWKAPPYEYEHEKLPFDILCGTDQVRKQIEAGASLEELEESWASELEKFGEIRRRYLLY
ncbi:DUF1343 domain-containing protein [Acidobacteria bacterium AH-259-L09]|nr:DUF1343 domain-containing protein [Acidobacteria bacterium AH-259-L09]